MGRYEKDIAIRIVSGASSGLIIILLGRGLSEMNFAHMQIYFSYGGLLGWLFDFGLLGLAYIHAAKDKLALFGSCWRLRSRMLAVPIVAIIVVSLLGFVTSITAMLILIGMQEFIVDGHLPIRQIMRSSLANTLSVMIRKVLQLLILVILFFEGSTLNLYQTLLIFGIPSALVLISDVVFFSRFKGKIDVGVIKKSSKYFFQSAGTSLATLDYFLIGHFGFQNIIYPYALGKKFYSFLMIPGTTFLQSIIKIETKIGNRLVNFWREIRNVVKITALFSCLSTLFFITFSQLLLGSKLSLGNILLTVLLILLPILGSVSTNLNGILVGRSLFRRASIATFLSSVFYLASLYIGFALGINEYVVLCVALVLNLVSEIYIYIRQLFNAVGR